VADPQRVDRDSDSGAFAYTHSAFNEAYRAVQELP
jgi:hypothetical protein